MENYSGIDIFDTKGLEYLFVIGYLIVLAVVWKISGIQIKVKEKTQTTISSISSNMLKIPLGLFYNKNHTWTHIEESGVAKVGINDLIQHLTGKVQLTNCKNPGDKIKKGELIVKISQEDKQLLITAPISGEILTINETLFENSEFLNEAPYQKGWLYKIKPTNWIQETNSCLFAEDAINWFNSEVVKFKDFLTTKVMSKYSSEPSMSILQDGGEIQKHVLSELPEEVWEEFQKEFLDEKR